MKGRVFSPAPRRKSLCSRRRLGFSTPFTRGQFTWYAVPRADNQGFVPNPLSLSFYPFSEGTDQIERTAPRVTFRRRRNLVVVGQ